MHRLILLSSFLLLFVSCGKNAMPWDRPVVYTNNVEPAEAEPYVYELGNNKCSTGPHSYPTLSEVCRALLNDELNNNCVEDKRKELYASSCPENV